MAHQDQIQHLNQPILQAFDTALQQQGLAKRTIQRHMGNIKTLAVYLAETTEPREPKLLTQIDADDFSSFLDDIAVYKKILLSRSRALCLPSSLRQFVDWASSLGYLNVKCVQECLELLQSEQAPYLEHVRMSLAALAERAIHGLDTGMLSTQGWRDNFRLF